MLPAACAILSPACLTHALSFCSRHIPSLYFLYLPGFSLILQDSTQDSPPPGNLSCLPPSEVGPSSTSRQHPSHVCLCDHLGPVLYCFTQFTSLKLELFEDRDHVLDSEHPSTQAQYLAHNQDSETYLNKRMNIFKRFLKYPEM